jgi:hypothetical protein
VVRRWFGPRNIRRLEMRKINVARIPELKTRVGIYGSARQQEVGGVYCGGVFIYVIGI